MAKTDWTLTDTVKPDDFNNIGREINQLRADVDHIEVPAASLTEAGIVQLSNATDSASESQAATSKALKDVCDAANTANSAAAAAQITANAAETPTGAQTKINAAVGNLASLQTTAKGNAVAAINELFTSASNGKTAVAAAITGKGVPASGSDTFGQLAQKITGIKSRPEDAMQVASDLLGRILAYESSSVSSSKITLDKDNNVMLLRRNSNVVVLLSPDMTLIHEYTTNGYEYPIISPEGQYYYLIFRRYDTSRYEHFISKYAIGSGAKLWETTTERTEYQSIDIATNGAIVVCLWRDSRLQMLNASNGALIRTVTLDFGGYDNVLWDEGLGMFVCLWGDSRMGFIKTDGTIYKTTTTLAQSTVERRHLSKNIYKFVYGRELYRNTQF